MTAGSNFTGSSFIAGSANSFLWTSRSKLSSDADGNVRATNNAATGFQSLVLGATMPTPIGSAPTHGQTVSVLQAEELLTIAAAATTTTMQIPTNAVVMSVSVRVTTVIPTATTFHGEGRLNDRQHDKHLNRGGHY